MAIITISAQTIDYKTDATGVVLRLRPSHNFLTAESKPIVTDSVVDITCTRGTRTASTGEVVPTLLIPSFKLDSTRDALDYVAAYWIAEFIEDSVRAGAFEGFDQFQLPASFSTGTTATWALIRLFNAAAAPYGFDRSTYSREQVDLLTAGSAAISVTITALNTEVTAARVARVDGLTKASLDARVDADYDGAIARSNHTGTQSYTTITGLGTAANLNVGTGASQIPQLDSGGKLLSSILPAIAISDTFVVASQAAQLALTAEVGDVAVRSDQNKSYILRVADATILANWQELLTPTDAVLSVAGRTGAVTLAKADVSLSLVANALQVSDVTVTGSGLLSRATSSGVDGSTVVNVDLTLATFNEAVDDRVNTLFVAGSGITLTYNDAANTFTVVATGAGSSDASDTVKGATKLSVAAASAANPIAVGDNDARMSAATASQMGLMGTGAQTFAGAKTFQNQIVSTLATGTAPFSITSTTKVTNLNADFLDGIDSASFATLAGTEALTNKTVSGGTFSGTIAGTPSYSGNHTYSAVSVLFTGDRTWAGSGTTSIGRNTVNGLSMGGSGTTNDLLIFNTSGGGVLRVPTATANIYVGGALVVGDNTTTALTPPACSISKTSVGLTLTAGTGTSFDFYIGTSGGSDVAFVPTGTNNWRFAGKVGIGMNPSAYDLQLTNDSAAKPSTSAWTVASDARLKDANSIRPYDLGLSELRQLNPVFYRYNGKAGMPADTENVGFLAQEVQSIKQGMGMISTFHAKLNNSDADDTELLGINPHNLQFMIINSVKTLVARLEAVEARLVHLEVKKVP